MRLYLSSFRLGHNPQAMVALVDKPQGKKTALVVANACDLSTAEKRRSRLEKELRDLRGLGFAAEELDLRSYFGYAAQPHSSYTALPIDLDAVLSACDLVWVRGGNPFVLRRAMRQSGFDLIVKTRLQRDALAYGGYSGGIAVIGPTLRGVELVSDPVHVPDGYDPETIWEGLGLCDYSLVSHFRCEHPSSPAIEGVVRYLADRKMPFKTLRDGEALVISGARESLLPYHYARGPGKT